jgi:hypothetical protein
MNPAATFGLLLLASGAAQEAGPERLAIGVELEADLALPRGSLRFDERPARGDRLELSSDLGAGGLRPSAGGRASVAFEDETFEFGGRAFEFRGRTTLSRDARFNETLFSAGEEVDSVFRIQTARLAWDHRFESIAEGTFHAGLEVRYWRLEVVMSSDARGRDDDHMGTAAPLVRAGFERPLGDGAIRLRVHGYATVWKLDDRSVRVLGGEASLAVSWGAAEAGPAVFAERADLLNRDRIQRNELELEAFGVGASIAWRF